MHTHRSNTTTRQHAIVVVLFLLSVLSMPVPVQAMASAGFRNAFDLLANARRADAPARVSGIVSPRTGRTSGQAFAAVQSGDRVALLAPPYVPLLTPTDNVTITTNTTWVSDTVVLNSLVITNSATLTLTGATVITATDVTVAEGAVISADGQGYGSQQGPGAGEYSYDKGAGGGGYGGAGGQGQSGASGGSVYGSAYEPATLGSGGGYRKSESDCGGAGGGAVHLVVTDTLQVDGTLSAAGAGGAVGNRGCGGGSGGSLWVETDILTGSGTIQADGGAGSGTTNVAGGGGGGRIAIYANTDSFEGTVQARGGSGYEYGGPGTVYRKGSTGLGTLLVDNGGNDGPSAGLVGWTHEFDTVELTGYGHLTVISTTSVLTLANDTLVGDGTAWLVGEGVIAAPSHFDVTTATLVVEGDLSGAEYITVTGSGGLELHAHTPYHAGVYTFTGVTVGPSTTLTLISYDDGDAVYTDDYGLELRVEDVAVVSGGSILADGQGYGSQQGLGAGAYSYDMGAGGGGHGGSGGQGEGGASGGGTYGSVYGPVALGSGGGYRYSETECGGAGGGAVYLVVSDTLQVDGTLSANGGDGEAGGRGCGGGSGGSLWIETDIITGSGVIRANGGDGSGTSYVAGGGGGGRIAIYADTNHFSGTKQALGGTGYEAGEAGTVYLDDVDPLSSTIMAAPNDALVADGVMTSTITVTLLTASGYPVPGKEVALEITQGTDNIVNGVPITDYVSVLIGTSGVSGTVTATLASTKAETKTVTAWAEDVRLLDPATVTFVAGDADADESYVWVYPTELAADGVTTATVYVHVYDEYGNPVPGATVVLSDTGSGTTLTQPAETGTDGQTQGAIRSAAVEVVTVSAIANGVSIVDTAQVTFVGADLHVIKSGPGMALAGTSITYSLTIENEGELAAEGIVVTDTLPAGTTFVTHTAPYSFAQAGQVLTWQVVSLTKDAQASFDLVAAVAPTVTHSSKLENEVTATTSSPGDDAGDNTDTATTTVYQPEPELEVTPSYSELTLQRGTTTTLALQVENVGTAVASDLTVSAPSHLGWVSVDPTSLPNLWPQQSDVFTATLSPPADLQVGTYRDLVTVQTDGDTQRSGALSIRVVNVTRTLAISVTRIVTGTPVPVAGASVHLVRQGESLLVTEGVTKTIHDQVWAETGEDGLATLEELEVGAYDYTIIATGYGATQDVVTVTAGSGTQQLAVQLSGLPLLSLDPLYPEIHVRPGETGLVETTVRNAGLGAAHNVQVIPPALLDWIYAGVIGATGELTAGQALSVTLFASPPATLTTGIYQEYVAVSADDTSDTRFALTVRVGTWETGTLQLRITDPSGAPLVGARVTLVSQESTLLVTEGVTQTYYETFVGTTGDGGVVSFEAIPAGGYSYHVDADGYEQSSVDVVVDPGEICLEDAQLAPLPFEATWHVEETEITDVYSVTVHLTFVADRLQVLPLEIVAPCVDGIVYGTIEVRNSSASQVTGVEVWGKAPGTEFSIGNQGATIGPGEVEEFSFSAEVEAMAHGKGWIAVSANEVPSSWGPVQIKMQRCGGGSGSGGALWTWSWDEDGPVGSFRGSSPSFENVDPPPISNGPTTVRLKLNQTAMLERQAFLAELALSDAITEVTGLTVTITARDQNGVPQPTHFTITPTVPTELPDLVPGGSTVRQQWTIVPAYLGITQPTTYTLRATLVYTMEDESHALLSLPEVIAVQPQPEVHVEYFVPRYVRDGEPVLLGVRAENRGFGTARNLRIASAYPAIVSRWGEPVGFQMLGTLEDGELQPDKMLLELGDIPPSSTVTGGWMMEFSYHGRFTELGVQCKHADYMGMALSNLLYCDGGENFFRNDLQHLNGDECPIISAADKVGFFGGPINTRSGNYAYAATDLSVPTAAGLLRMARSYNSSEVPSDTGTLSPGWTHQYAMRLEFPDLSNGSFFTVTTGDATLDRSTVHYRPYVVARLPGGSQVRFAEDGDGTYTTYPGAQASLVIQEVGGVTTYTLTAADQTKYVYDDAGQLQAIHDRRGNETQLTYTDGLLTRITGPTGLRWLDLGYDGQDRLAWVRDPVSRTVQYGYDGNGDLVVVTDTRGMAWTYAYTGTHLLYEVRDPAGALVERTDYVSTTVDEDTGWRATTQEDGAGTQLSLSYEENETTIVEEEQTTVHRYDLFGTLIEQVDPAGRAQDYGYNWDFRRELSTDALERTTRMAWNACCGQLAAITDTLGNVTRMAYDGNNNLTEMTDAAGRRTTYEYDGNNNLIAQSDALSHTIRYSYDAYGHVISTTDALSNTTLYGYDQFGQRTVVTDALGNVTTYGYDSAGRLVTTTAPSGLVVVNTYDDGDNLVQVVRNYVGGYPQNYQDTYNLVTGYGYDEVGRRVVTTDTLGRVTGSEYDAAGRLVRSIRNVLPGYSQNHQDTYNLTTEYGYDQVGNQVLVTDTLGNVTYTEYDELNRPVTVTTNYLPGYSQNYQNTYNLATAYGYDAVGNQVLVTDTLGNVTYTEYDELNRVWRVWRNYLAGYAQNYQDTYNLVTEYGYDEVGNQVLVTDTLSHVTHTGYDELNRPVTVTTNYMDGVFDPAHPDEDLARVTAYDAAGRVAQVTDHASRVTHYTYDGLGRQVIVIQNYQDGTYDPSQPDQDLTSLTVYDEATGQVAARVQVADERITTTYGYDAAGRLVTTTNALSTTTVTEYDALGRRVETVDAEGNSTAYAYDAAGRLVTTTNALSGTIVTAYDALGRRVATVDPLDYTTVYTYDGAGRLAAQADPLGNVTYYAYDALGRRTVVTDADGVAIYSTYDVLGRLVASTDALSNSTQYGYNALGNRVVMTAPQSMASANFIATRYEYDDLGRLIGVTENYSPTGPSDHQTNVYTEYGYDATGSLVAVTNALSHTTVYTYDLAGRRVGEADPLGNVTRYQYDGHGRRVGEIYPDAGGSITVTLDYNSLGWPTQIDYPAIGDVPGFTVEYSYNALGHRSAVTDAAGSTSYDYDALYRPLGIDAPTGEAQYLYDAAGRRTNLIYPTGETVTYTHDAAGRLHTVTDWDGGVTVYTYTAAGRLSGMRLPNDMQTTYDYDGAGRLVEIEHRGSAGELLARYEYTLDGVGNRVAVTETIASPSGGGAASLSEQDTLWTQNVEDRSVPIASRGHPGHAALVPESSSTGSVERSDAAEISSGRAAWMRGGRLFDLSVVNLTTFEWLPARVQPRSGVPVVSLLPRAGFLARPMQSPTSTVVITQNTTWTSDTVVGTLVVTNSATLTLTGAIVITATDITVVNGASISADGQGYGSQQGPGAGAYSYDDGAGGGGHGGAGGQGQSGVSGGSVYGSAYEPVTLGSGGGYRKSDTECGGAGGGAVYLVVSDTLQVDGTLSADGTDGATGTSGCGGGGGGSLWIETNIITGSGTIQADGGDGSGTSYVAGGGGGGRIAIYADTDDFEGTVQARGGSGYEYGGPGTVYRKGSTGLGTLQVNNGGNNGPSAGLVGGTHEFDAVELTGYGHLTVISSTSVLTLTNDTLVGDGTARLMGEGIIAAPSNLNVTTATLVVKGDLSGAESITVASSGGLELHAYTSYHAGVYTFTSVTVGPSAVVTLTSYDDGDAVYTDDYGLELRVNDLVIADGAAVSADGQGYGSQQGPGAGTYSYDMGGGGAGHGGSGGQGEGGASGGGTYGSAYEPVALGSGGGYRKSDTGCGGAGGGAVYLVVSDTLQVDGTLSADGTDGATGDRGCGGGSGGSLWVNASIVTGTGVIRAGGGDGSGISRMAGGGGGGRIAIYADTDNFDGTLQAGGGSGYEYGGSGTLHLDGLLILGFTADPLSGYAPLTVTFTNTTTGVATGYEWHFGDGATSVLTHPTHVYTAAGVYTVSLEATGPGGSDTLTRTNYVTVTSSLAAPHLEAGTVEGVSSSGYSTVTLARSYEEMVVIATAVYSDNTRPLVTRVRNAEDNSFQVKLQNPGDGYSLEGETVHYLVVEAGSYTLPDGGGIEARVFTSTLTDRRGSWVGQSLGYTQTYTTPVVLGQVMSENDADWSVFWDRGSSATTAPDSDNLWVGKHVGQDTDTDRADEVLGVVVMEAGSGSLGEVAYRASLGGDTVGGIGDSPPYAYSFSPAFSSAPEVALLSQAAMDGNDGGWAVLYGVGAAPLSASSVNLAVDEDQIKDGERSHTSEQVGYLAFEGALVYPGVSVVAGFSGSPLSGVAPLTVTFTNNSTGATNYEWDFGDSATSTLESPTHIYTATGAYTVSLTATGLGDSDTLTRTSYISVSSGGSGGPVTTTRVITYTYDPLNRLISATYSTGEQFGYGYDGAGNRTVMTDASGVTTYTYDAANRLTSVGGVEYTWDDRGNLVSDGTFTYTYNAAGRMVQAEGVTLTLVYTYNASGLRVAQSVDGDVTTFAWDWASGIPEMLSDGEDLYLVGHETLGQWDGADWTFYLPDALGSIRQETDEAGDVTDSREWTPFGVEVGTTQGGLGYTGEWLSGYIDLDLLYLRSRWYAVEVGRFTTPDTIVPDFLNPQSINLYAYVLGKPINFRDPSGYQSESEKRYIRHLYDQHLEDIAGRLNVRSLTNLSNDAFATMIAARILVEDATAFADRQPRGYLSDLLIALVGLRPWARDLLADAVFGGEISWGPANMRLDFVMSNLEWWETAYSDLGLNFEDVHTYYYDARDRDWFLRWLIGSEENMLELELMMDEGTANQMALAILRSSWRAKEYRQRKYLESGGCEQIPELSAYMIAMGIRFYAETDETLYTVSGWTSRGMPWDWVEAMDDTASVLGLHITRYVDYVPYTDEEREKLLTLPQ